MSRPSSPSTRLTTGRCGARTKGHPRRCQQLEWLVSSLFGVRYRQPRPAPIDGAGVPISSPGPRRYFQFSIDFFSDDFESAAVVGGLAFDVISPPFAQELIAEISPRSAAVGRTPGFCTRYSTSPLVSSAVLTPLRSRLPCASSPSGACESSGPGEVQEADFPARHWRTCPRLAMTSLSTKCTTTALRSLSRS